jgi:cytochrome c-type biogenesis protein CcmH
MLAAAVDMTPPLPTPELQQRYQDLTHELRCMQCQNEALADSTVGLAADLRLQVRELLIAGKTDEEIRDHMADRYSEFILFRPRMNWRNAWLWGLPAMLLLAGGVVVWRIQRQRSALAATDTAPIDGEPDRSQYE